MRRTLRHGCDFGLRPAQRARSRFRRTLLQKLTSTDFSNAAFLFRAAREIDIGFARVLCIRITYLGELGYELYVPAEQATHVYDRIVDGGTRIRPGARRTQGARERKHGKRATATTAMDIDNTDVPYEVGLGFCSWI